MSWQRTVFLLSNWFSGATVLTLLLDRHPSIVSSGEGFPFGIQDQGQYICSCQQSLESCSFYREAAAHLWRGDRYDPRLFVREPQFRLPGPLRRYALSPRFPGATRERLLNAVPYCRRVIRDWGDAHVEFMRRSIGSAGASVYLDATKSIRRAELLLSRVPGDVSLWLMVRDCRGFCWSALRDSGWPVGLVSKAARRWVEYIEFAERLATTRDLKLEIIRYEDLCSDPTGQLRRLLASIHLDFREDILGPGRRSHHILGNALRLSFDGILREDLAWQTGFGDGSLSRILDVAGPVMRRFQYC